MSSSQSWYKVHLSKHLTISSLLWKVSKEMFVLLLMQKIAPLLPTETERHTCTAHKCSCKTTLSVLFQPLPSSFSLWFLKQHLFLFRSVIGQLAFKKHIHIPPECSGKRAQRLKMPVIRQDNGEKNGRQSAANISEEKLAYFSLKCPSYSPGSPLKLK